MKNFGVTKPVEVVYNFVDLARFDKKPIDAFRKVIAPNGEKIIAHASNFRKVKRISDVIQVFAGIAKSLPVKMLMVGDGPERQPAEELARELGIAEHIRFVGKQEQVEEVLAVSDMFLLPSEYESFGLAALEAMAARNFVLSSDAGGLPEINVHGTTGWMAPVGDVAAMAAFAIETLSDNSKLATMQEAADQHAKKFDIAFVVPQYEKIYRRFCRNYEATANCFPADPPTSTGQ